MGGKLPKPDGMIPGIHKAHCLHYITMPGAAVFAVPGFGRERITS